MDIDITPAQHLTPELEEALAHLLPQLNPAYAPPSRQELQEMLASPGVSLLLARDRLAGGRIVGALCLAVFRSPTGLHAWIEDVVVDESARRRGIGEALTRAGIERARSLGAHSVNLTSRPSRVEANRLYQRMGFQKRETNLYRLSF